VLELAIPCHLLTPTNPGSTGLDSIYGVFAKYGDRSTWWRDHDSTCDTPAAKEGADLKGQPTMAIVPPAGSEPVLLVHGTFSFDESNNASPANPNRWWQRGSTFCVALDSMISPKGLCAPAGLDSLTIRPWWHWLWTKFVGETAPNPAPEAVFHWSGDNRESARRAAGQLLLDHMRQFDALGVPFHVVAHSHGGSILWEALFRAEREGKPLGQLASWTTVGAPFIRFRTDFSRLWLIIPLVLVVLMAALQWPWFADYWAQTLPQADAPWGFTFLACLLAYYALTALPALLIRLMWSFYSWTVAQDRPGLVPMARTREWDDIISTVLALIALMATAGAVALTVPARIRSLLRAADLRDLTPFFACLWFTLALIAAAGTLVVVVAVVYRILECRDRMRWENAAWSRYGAKYLGIALTRDDEAILGLRVVRRGVRGTILPRFPSPRESDFSPKYVRLRRPEQLYAWGAFPGWLFRYVLLPLQMVWQWVIIPLYNEVFATQVDEFVLDQLQKRATGSDLFALKVEDVVDHPMAGRTPGGTAGCSAATSAFLVKNTNANAPALVQALRRALALDSLQSVHLDVFFKAMQGDAFMADLLVHTSYFKAPALQGDVAGRVLGAAPALPAAPQPVVVGAAPEAGRKPINLWNFLIFLANSGVRLALVLIPASLLYLLGWGTFYEYSLEYHVNWAGEAGPAANAAVEDLNPFNAGDQYDSPPVVRWWVAKKLLDSDASTAWSWPARVVRWWVAKKLLDSDASTAWSWPARVVRWWVAKKLLDPSADDVEFVQLVEDPQKKILFYARVGQKFAEVRDLDKAADAFGKAGEAASALPGAILGNIAMSLAAVRRLLNDVDFQKIADQTNVEGLDRALKIQLGLSYQWRDLYNGYSSLAGSGGRDPTPDEVFEWALRRDADTDHVRLQKLAFLIAVKRPLSIDEKSLVDAFVQTADHESKEIPRDLTLTLLKQDLRHALTVVERTGGRSGKVLEKARELRKLIVEVARGTVTSRDIAEEVDLQATVALSESLRGREPRSVVEKLLVDSEGILDHPINRNTRVRLRPWVAGAYARAGDYRRARLLVKDQGPHARLYVATQLLVKAIELREADRKPPRLDEFTIRQAFDQDVGIERRNP
jgi:hypothetical protein